ncbi:quinohemoprotein amine dehydrogenase subunit alpha [Thauera butanivorans]|uniref:quinohemoprotein amine dehydrogenase subunit alpha n=1 Tax=Thauera butanivorans TaxID=86174 RepID=UPI000838084E|nr:quinohemoprotein amine dehydrogenase subunit alpha [Thauera butanivorans]
MKITKIAAAMSGVAAVGLALASSPAVAAASAEALLRAKCLACHTETDAGFSRIADQRKSPEGWLMSIARMQIVHGLKITDEERRAVVKHLADTQGLAPSETEGARYALERRLNTMEAFESEQFTQMCARCHSGARVLLQRRPASEWEHLVHFHLGQYPTAEFQAFGRDRDWLGIALKEVVPDLAGKLPLESEAWKAWQARAPQAVDGEWSLSGHMTGRGGFSGVMKVSAGKGQDLHALSFEGRWDDGKPMAGKGQALIYTGYEWRADLVVDGTPMRQVFALEDGVLRGRMFLRDHDEVGADVVASLQRDGNARVLAVHPAYLKAGEEGELRIVGSKLDGEVGLPPGVSLLETVKRSAGEVVLRVRAEAAARGVHPVTVGKAGGASLAVYERIGKIEVLPAYAVARIGGNGTPTAKVEARFDAEAWDAGPDGQPGTSDDFRIGVVPARWSVEPFDEVAVRDEDVKFAGLMDEATGVFVPGGAGPNPMRRMSANNVGNLKVVAEVEQGGTPVRGEGQLIVAPQRWNNPPIP